jgi:threonine dehydrogenase-like Zn-dependent dehydrogenase
LQWCRQARGYGGPVDGAHADLILTDERNCVPLPEPLTFADGAFIACAGGTAYSALKKLSPSSGETVAVFGLGPVGLSAVLLAHAMGARVVGVDIAEERLHLAHSLGAQAVIHAGQEDSTAALQQLTGGEGAAAAIEASGSAAGRLSLVASLRRGGRGVFLGVGSDEAVISPTSIINRQLTLMGSFVLPLGMAWELARFMVSQHLSFEPAVTHRFPIDQAPEAYALADAGKGGKVLFVWGS